MVRGNAPTGSLWRTCRLRQDGPLPAPFGLVSRTQIKRLQHIQQIAITPSPRRLPISRAWEESLNSGCRSGGA
jgi:hypothetical protein